MSLGMHETVLRRDFALYKLSFKPAPSSLDSLEKKPSVKLTFELYCYVSGYLALLSSSVLVDLPIVVVLRSYVKISGFMLRYRLRSFKSILSLAGIRCLKAILTNLSVFISSMISVSYAIVFLAISMPSSYRSFLQHWSLLGR